jgi:hypothetical protein
MNKVLFYSLNRFTFTPTHSLPLLQLRLPSKFRSKKIPQIRLGTVFVIPRKNALLSQNSMFVRIANSEVQSINEIPEKNVFKGHPCVFLCPRMVRNEFPQIIFRWFRTKFRMIFSSMKWFGTGF